MFVLGKESRGEFEVFECVIGGVHRSQTQSQPRDSSTRALQLRARRAAFSELQTRKKAALLSLRIVQKKHDFPRSQGACTPDCEHDQDHEQDYECGWRLTWGRDVSSRGLNSGLRVYPRSSVVHLV